MGSFAYRAQGGDSQRKPRDQAQSSPPSSKTSTVNRSTRHLPPRSPRSARSAEPKDEEDYSATPVRARRLATLVSSWALSFLNAFHAPDGTPPTLNEHEWPGEDLALTAAINEGITRHDDSRASHHEPLIARPSVTPLLSKTFLFPRAVPEHLPGGYGRICAVA